ncbi:MAG: type II toxin-antitoxin system HigB family toxin [Bacteroidia bacterium]|nr:type II toxin-antitoxin system HigB family toxin [Bacteroidia bacterium]
MNIYNKSSIIKFYTKHADAKVSLEIWYEELEKKTWKSPNKLKAYYGGNVSILKNSRVAFDINGNDYRLIVVINYENGWLFIKFIGTHVQYDKIDANTIDLYKAKPNRNSERKQQIKKNEHRSNKK